MILDIDVDNLGFLAKANGHCIITTLNCEHMLNVLQNNTVTELTSKDLWAGLGYWFKDFKDQIYNLHFCRQLIDADVFLGFDLADRHRVDKPDTVDVRFDRYILTLSPHVELYAKAMLEDAEIIFEQSKKRIIYLINNYVEV